MLPPFIIEQIRQREEQERTDRREKVLELPLPPAPQHKPAEDDVDRGFVIIDPGA